MERIAQIISEACGEPFDAGALIATSPYLKHDRLREWVGYLMLHRPSKSVEGAYPVQVATAHMRMVREIVDRDHINMLFAEERRKNPALDAYLGAKHVSTFTLGDLAAFPEGSLGGAYYRRLASMGADVKLDLGADLPITTDFDYWVVRGLQLHDLEHLLGGGGFNYIGEIMPSVMRSGSLFRHLGSELAGILNIPTYLTKQSQLSGAMLYRPEAYPLMLDRFHRAWLIGQTSGPYFLARLEDYFHLPLAQARRALDINNVDEVDTSAMSARIMEDA
jgi:ubiquinone biosynthesis protein Coq4